MLCTCLFDLFRWGENVVRDCVMVETDQGKGWQFTASPQLMRKFTFYVGPGDHRGADMAVLFAAVVFYYGRNT